jgi:hypothetical protein
MDSFGNSKVTPTLFSLYGYDTLFLARLGLNYKNELKESGHL